MEAHAAWLVSLKGLTRTVNFPDNGFVQWYGVVQLYVISFEGLPCKKLSKWSANYLTTHIDNLALHLGPTFEII